MQLGKALLGAIIGGALGIGLLIVIHSATGWDKYWLAIPVALLTGLGVRWMVSTKGHPSYARGALTGVLGILAFMAGNYLVAELATRRTAEVASKPVVVPQTTDADDEADTETTEEAPARIEPVRNTEPVSTAGGARNARPQQASPWDYFWLGIAALIAYELGRGTGTAPTRTSTDVRDDGFTLTLE